jgi:hypothetical protein
MGTRSLTHVFDDRNTSGDERPLVTIYRQMDGYPSGHGEDLAAILRGRRIINGYGMDDTDENASNGMGCLAATIVAKLKADAGLGGIYIYPAGSRDCGEEYTYTVRGKPGEPIRLTVHASGYGILFDGLPEDFANVTVPDDDR